MASTDGHTSASLKEALNQKPTEYSFFQVIRLLERSLSHQGLRSGKIRVAPQLSLESTGAEVTHVQTSEHGQQVETSFLGLYGISSPLPPWYTASLQEAQAEDRPLAKVLLDIIQQRYYTLYFQALAKYQVPYQLLETQQAHYTQYLFHLLGISHRYVAQFVPDPYQLLRYIALFRQNPHSALGLQTILEDALQVAPIVVEQAVPRRTQIPALQVLRLGEQAHQVGVNTVLGDEIEDTNGKLKIVFGPLSFATFQTLLNGSQTCLFMIFLIEAYLNVPLECDLEFILAENAVRPLQFGDPETSCLGQNSWVFSGDEPGTLRTELSFFFFKNLYNS